MLRKPEFQHLFIGKEKTGFSKCYHSELDEDLGEEAAQLILNIDIRSTAVPGEEVADELYDVLKNNFFQDLEKDPYSRFEESLKMMNDVVLEKESQYGSKFLANISVVVAVITGNTLFLSQHGDAEAYLVRKRHVNVISEGLHEGGKSEELFANIASGGVSSSDKLVYSTARLYRYVTKMDLAKIFSDYDLKESLRELDGFVSMDAVSRISVCVVGMRVLSESGAVAELGGEKKFKKKKNGFYSKFSHIFADNKVVGFLSEKLNDLRHWLNKGMDNKTVVGEWRRLGRDKVLLSLILVVIVLVAGIYLVRNQGQKQKYIEELEVTLEQVSEKISEAETKGTYDKDKAAELLNEAEDAAMEVLASGYLRASASQYLNSVEEQRDYLDNVIRVSDVTLFADLSEKRSTVSALGLVPYQGSLYAYEYNGLYEIVLGEVQDPLTIDDDEIVISGAYFEDQDSLLFFTEDGDVIEYDGFTFSFMDSETGFNDGIEADPYSSRIYVLDPDGGQIWKYYRQRESYGSAEGYILEDVDLSLAVSMAIDGSVWILNSDGSITKLLSGLEEMYDLERTPLTSFAGATKIYTAYEMSQIYVLDPANSRVIVFNKDSRDGDLVYSTQYVFEGLDDLKDVYVAQDENRMYLLTESEVYYYGY